MRRKAITARSTIFIFAVTAATLTLIFSAPNARAATITNTTDPTAVPILLPSASNTTNWLGTISAGTFAGEQVDFSSSQPVNVSAGATGTVTPVATTTPTDITVDTSSTGLGGKTFTDLTFQTQFTANPNPSAFTVEGSDGSTTMGSIGNGTGPGTTTFTADNPLTSVVLMPSRSTPIGNFGLSGLQQIPLPEIPLPAGLPLFAGGLATMGLLGWRRKRGQGSCLAAA